MVFEGFSTPSNIGWYVVFLYVIYQLYAPKFGLSTRLTAIIDNFREEIREVGKRIEDVEDRQDKIERRQEKVIAIHEIITVNLDDFDGSAVKNLFGDKDVVEEDKLIEADTQRQAND